MFRGRCAADGTHLDLKYHRASPRACGVFVYTCVKLCTRRSQGKGSPAAIVYRVPLRETSCKAEVTPAEPREARLEQTAAAHTIFPFRNGEQFGNRGNQVESACGPIWCQQSTDTTVHGPIKKKKIKKHHVAKLNFIRVRRVK